MKVVVAKGNHERAGYEIGCQVAPAIKNNVALCEHKISYTRVEVEKLVRNFRELSSPSSIMLMRGMSRGSGVPFAAILRFNALEHLLIPEGCTTFAAVGSATPDGKAILLKNRDTGGNAAYKGEGYHQNREVNITLALKTDDGNTMVGVTVAGSTGFMMGLNKYGLAAACNFGQAAEISHLSSQELYGISGRTQMLREGLECSSVTDAVNLTLGKLTRASMGTPGILWFADAKNIFIIEGSFGQFALQHVTDGIAVRSNHFALLDHLNDEKAISSLCRKIRGQELAMEAFGKIDRKKLIEFSMDHKNGPEANSICRHSPDPEESATVSASIMELEDEHPEKSRISIALGSPCQAWRHGEGNFTFQMDQGLDTIPQGFLDGSAYKKFFG